MRRLASVSSVAFVLALVLGATTVDAQPNRSLGWQPAGRCLPNFWGGKLPCVRITAADAATLQRFVAAYLSPQFLKQHARWRKARTLVMKPSSDGFIGHFTIDGWGHAGFTGDVVKLVAVDEVENGIERGFKLVIGRTKLGWTVLYKDHYHQHLPEPD